MDISALTGPFLWNNNLKTRQTHKDAERDQKRIRLCAFFLRGTGSKGAEMKNKVFPLSMAILWGIVYTNALGSTALGICLGLLMGMVFGLFESGNDTGDQ